MTVSHSSSAPHAGRLGPIAWSAIVLAAGLFAYLVIHALTHDADAVKSQPHIPPLWGIGTVPFVCILAAIALLPLIPATHHWWESNRNRLIVSVVFAGMTLVYYLLMQGVGSVVHVLEHAIIDEYVPFIVLLFSLYVISGGINLKGTLRPTPLTNTTILAIGALIASVVGTTGASMLLIRPLLQANAGRSRVTHTVIFFIFLVSNIGGCLLPIGDPPLFLGYLRGVPFLWTIVLWKEWAFCVAMLLVMYYAWDAVLYKRDVQSKIIEPPATKEPLRIRGSINFVWLMLVVAAVALLGHQKPFPGTTWIPFQFLRELVMSAVVILSLWTTPRGVREDNRFNYTAILEVAALFIGIFITMQVPIQVLNVMGGDLGLTEPWQYFWITGGLSSVLDNAPTYVVFFETANALTHEPGEGIIQMLDKRYIREDLLIAISLGAVFMGANTYIGNGPNFMVKSIAEQSGVKMPSFFGFFFRYSLPILIPLFIIVTVLFLR